MRKRWYWASACLAASALIVPYFRANGRERLATEARTFAHVAPIRRDRRRIAPCSPMRASQRT